MTWQVFWISLLWAFAIAFFGWSLAKWIDRIQMRREKHLRKPTNVFPMPFRHGREGGR